MHSTCINIRNVIFWFRISVIVLQFVLMIQRSLEPEEYYFDSQTGKIGFSLLLSIQINSGEITLPPSQVSRYTWFRLRGVNRLRRIHDNLNEVIPFCIDSIHSLYYHYYYYYYYIYFNRHNYTIKA